MFVYFTPFKDGKNNLANAFSMFFFFLSFFSVCKMGDVPTAEVHQGIYIYLILKIQTCISLSWFIEIVNIL